MSRRPITAGALLLAAGWACAEPWEPPPPELEARERAVLEVAETNALLERADDDDAARALSHGDHRVRRAALLRLMTLGPEAAGHTPAAVELLKDEHPRVRTAAARALAAMGDERAFDPLLDALPDRDRAVRLWVWKSIMEIGEPIFPAIIRRLGADVPEGASYRDERGTRTSMRTELRNRCAQIGRGIVPALSEALSDEDPLRRLNAAQILGDLGDEAAEAIPALVSALETRDDDAKLRARIVRSLGSIGDVNPLVVPALDAASKDGDKELSALARKALKDLRKPTKGQGKKAPKHNR